MNLDHPDNTATNPVTGDPEATDATLDDLLGDPEGYGEQRPEPGDDEQKDGAGPLAALASAVRGVFTSDRSDDKSEHETDAEPRDERPVAAAPPASESAEPDQQPEADGPGPGATVSEEEQREIAEERERRLDPANRPPNSEVDNTDYVVDDDEEDAVGSSDPRKRFREMEVSEEEQREIAEERKRRLDPANRPPNSEVDNTHRTFEGDHFVD